MPPEYAWNDSEICMETGLVFPDPIAHTDIYIFSRKEEVVNEKELVLL
jgi:hypothetical protein